LKKGILLLTIFFLLLSAELFARGKTEEPEKKPQNNEWILCVTDFDTSSLQKEKESIANVITRNLVENLKGINYRSRISPEHAYYEENAWTRQRSVAAKALATKMEERSLLLYKGEEGWKYKKNLSKIDIEIEKLKNAMEIAENEAPLINMEPEFSLTKGNLDFSFPPPPKEGDEYKFCQTQKADAFLAGTIMEFHGRYYLAVKLYNIFTKSFTNEDSIIFSPEDLDSALDEIIKKIMLTVSVNRPAAIIVKAEPKETLVLINKSFAGRGETEVTEYSPGKVTISASAENYNSMVMEADLLPGELTEIDIKLTPLTYGNVLINSTSPHASVYQGALYVGEAPLTLRLPLNKLEYIELVSSNVNKGAGAFFTPEQADTFNSLSLGTSKVPPHGRVDKARRMYYWAWGGTWVTGIAAWISYHSFLGYQNAVADAPVIEQGFESNYMRMNYISAGAMIAVGAAVAYEIFHIGRYVNIANKGSTPILKTSKSKQETEK